MQWLNSDGDGDKRRFNYLLLSGDGGTFSTFKKVYKIITQHVDHFWTVFFSEFILTLKM